MLSAYDIAKKSMGGKEPQPSGSGWAFQCPVHGGDDYKAWIADNTTSAEGAPYLKCEDGCKLLKIKQSLRTKKLWLWDKRKQPVNKENLERRLTATWFYSNKAGQDCLKVLRFNYFKLDGSMVPGLVDYTEQKPDGEGWINCGPNVSAPVLHWEEIQFAAQEGKILVSVDSEEECKLLRAFQIQAFTHAGGSRNVRRFLNSGIEEDCQGCNYVLVIPQPDDKGRKSAAAKCAWLHKNNIPVKLLNLPDLVSGETVEDWLLSGRTATELKELARDTPFWSPKSEEDTEKLIKQAVEVDQGDNVVELFAPPDELKNPFSEKSAALTLARMYGDVAKYVPKLGRWLLWNGRYWEKDEAEEIKNLAAKAIERKYKEYKVNPKLDQEKVAKWYARFGNRQPLGNMINLAQSDCKAKLEQFDADRMKLNCANGIIDLTTGELLPHSKEALCTKMIPWEYRGLDYEDCPRWLKFLTEVFVRKDQKDGRWIADPDTIACFARCVGYSLTGNVKEKKFFVLMGQRNAGKSVIGERILMLLGKGQYSKTASKRVILLMPQENKYSDFLNIAFARAVVMDEIGAKDTIDDEKLKSATGGDELPVSHQHQDVFSVPSTAKLWIYGNDPPKVHANGNEATWIRITVFPFYRTFEETEQQKNLDDILNNEMPGILSWAVRGCLDWQASKGVCPSALMNQAKAEYRKEMDELQGFIEAYCEVGEKFSEESQILFDAHYQYQRVDNKLKHTWSQTRFGKELIAKGYTRFRDTDANRTTRYLGLRLLPQKRYAIQGGGRVDNEKRED